MQRILILSRYGRLGASSRLRFLQYLPYWERGGVRCEFSPFLSDDLLSRKYAVGRYGLRDLLLAYAERILILLKRREFDLVLIEKEALPWLPSSIEAALLSGVPYAIDFDDAIFHNYDRHPLRLVRSLFGKRIDNLMGKASLIVAGNQYLASRALTAGAKVIEKIPTVIDLDRYVVQSRNQNEVKRIVWIGSPSTAKYLKILEEPLRRLALKQKFIFRVIGAEIEMSGVDVEILPWNESTEVDLIRACDMGVMPLMDTPWEQGKCGYKLIQYMACGLPVVASPVGANLDIVHNGKNGYLASTSDEWYDAFESLMSSDPLSQVMGKAGRKDVEDKYCVQRTASIYLQALISAARNKN